jgi:hypothetical protein
MESEAAEYRLLAGKFRRKAREARLPARKAFRLSLERRYILLAEINEKEAQKLRASAIGLRPGEAARFRQLAAEAKQSGAEVKDPSKREIYLEIEREWLFLAKAYEELDEMERSKAEHRSR